MLQPTMLPRERRRRESAAAVKEPDGEKAARMADLAARTAFQATERVAKGYMMAVTMSSEDAEGDAEEDDEE